MYLRAVERWPFELKFVSGQYMIQEIREGAVEPLPYAWEFVPGQYITQEMYEKAVHLHCIKFRSSITLKGCVKEL